VNRSALGAAAPELFAGFSFLFALAAPHAWRNFDLVYSSTAIVFLEFFMVHAGVFAAAVRGARDQANAASTALALGVVYAVLAIAFGIAFGAGYAAFFIALSLIWRFFAAMGTESSFEEFKARGFAMLALFLVLSMIVIVGGFAPRLGVDSATVGAVRTLELRRGVNSNFDPARTTAFLTIWYFALAFLEYRRVARRPVAERDNALVAAGLSLDARAGRVTLTRATANWSRLLFLCFGAFGTFFGVAGLIGTNFGSKSWVLLPIGAALLAGIGFGLLGLRMGSERRNVLTVERGRVTIEERTAGLPGLDVSRVMADVTEFSPVPVQHETGGSGHDLLIETASASPAHYLCGVPKPTLVALARLLIAVYRFGDQRDVLRVALGTEPELRELLDDAAERRLTGGN
jgi:hypothetical protein